MRARMVVAAGVGLLALAACSRGGETSNETGVVKGTTGLEVNMATAAGDCISLPGINRPAAQIAPEQRQQIVACLNAATVRQVGPQLPRQMDEVTRLDRLSTEGPTLIYHYTILRQLSPTLGPQLEAAQRRLTCAEPQARQTVAFGGSYGFRWTDSEGTLIHEMRINAC